MSYFSDSIDHFLGFWVKQSDGSTGICYDTTRSRLQCEWGIGPVEYLISGTRIQAYEFENIWGTLNNDKDRITWPAYNGESWIKRGNNMKHHLRMLK